MNIRAFVGYIIRHDVKFLGISLSNIVNLLGLYRSLEMDYPEINFSNLQNTNLETLMYKLLKADSEKYDPEFMNIQKLYRKVTYDVFEMLQANDYSVKRV